MFDNPLLPGSYVRKAIKQRAVAEVPYDVKQKAQQGVVTLWPGISKREIEDQVEAVLEVKHEPRLWRETE